jgi:hypothetical protein
MRRAASPFITFFASKPFPFAFLRKGHSKEWVTRESFYSSPDGAVCFLATEHRQLQKTQGEIGDAQNCC